MLGNAIKWSGLNVNITIIIVNLLRVIHTQIIIPLMVAVKVKDIFDVVFICIVPSVFGERMIMTCSSVLLLT